MVENAIAEVAPSEENFPNGLAHAVVAALDEEVKLSASDGAAGDEFGFSIAISGNRALVGARLDDTAAGNDAGSAYVFAFDGALWVEEAKLTASDGAAGDEFGSSVALLGNHALVGAPYDDVNAQNSGSAYVFTFDGGTWTEEAKLTGNDDDDAFDDRFGSSVDLSGDRALVGVPTDDTEAGNGTGSAYVFVFDGASWIEEAKLVAGDADSFDGFGSSVSLSGNRALVGAHRDDDAGEGSGSAYVFAFDGGLWVEETKLTASDAEVADFFGFSVALSGDRALVGALFTDDAGSNSGSAYVFAFDGGVWIEKAKLTASDADSFDGFGISVALSGDHALVGALPSTGPELRSGWAYAFTFDGESWTEEAKLTAGDALPGDYVGYSAALEGGRALIGAPADDDHSALPGSAYVFEFDGSGSSALVITGVVDGPLSGGTPKAVELYALDDVADLSLYAVGSANNGGGTDGPEFVLSGSATAGDYLYVASESDQFEAFFGFAPDFTDSAANINGDDAIELFFDDDGFGTGNPELVIDTFGEIDVSGSGQPWEYLDGWAYRNDGSGPDGSAFELDNWTFSGVDALDGETSNASAATPFPIATYTAEVSATPVMSFTESSATVAEGDDVTLTVQLDFPNDTPDGNPVTVTVTLDEEASTASASDFDSPTPVQVTFDGTTDGEEQSVTVSTTPDEAIEGDETAVFDLIVAGGIAEVGTPGAFALTIEDGDAPGPARVQVIHNAADPAAELVDISIVDLGEGGDGATFQDVPFRAATPFFDLAPATYQVTITDEEDLAVVIIDETVTVASGETYQLIASGVADPSEFEPNPDGQAIAAELFVNAEAREVPDEEIVEVNFVQGATDVSMASIGTAISDLVYGDISPYFGAPPLEFGVSVEFDNLIGEFFFVVDFFNRFDEVGTLLISGFLTPENDQDGPFVGLLVVYADGTTAFVEPTVRSSLAVARTLPLGTQVMVEGVVTRALGDFTRLQDGTAGLTVRQPEGPFNEDVGDGTIAPGTELRVTGVTSEFRQLFQINEGGLIGYEVLGTTDVPEPQLVTLEEIATEGEAYESELIQVENLVVLPDGDTVFQPATTYDLLEFDVQFPVTLRTPNADDTEIDGEPIPSALATFTGVLGQFDFSDPAAGYQLLPVQADDVAPQDAVTVPVQIIHNAPDPAFAEVDVYLDGALVFDNFAFRTATPFEPLPADIEIEVAVAPGDSDGMEDAVFTATYTLDSEANYQLVATGIGEGDFEPNPDGEDIAFALLINPEAKLFSETDDEASDLNFVHGTPDAPTIDVRTGETQDIILFNDVTYGAITGYQPIVPGTLLLDVSTADGTTTVASFEVDLTERIDEAGTILASGFLTPENEPDGAPGFGLLVVFADGSEAFLEPLVTPNAEGEAAAPTAFAVDGNYPNPFARRTTLRYDLPADAEVSVEVYDVLGRRVAEVAPQAVAAGAGRTVTLDAVLPSGTYVYRVTADLPTETRTETGRMTVVR